MAVFEKAMEWALEKIFISEFYMTSKNYEKKIKLQ